MGSIQILGSNNSSNNFDFGYIIFPVLNCDLAAIEQAERSNGSDSIGHGRQVYSNCVIRRSSPGDRGLGHGVG